MQSGEEAKRRFGERLRAIRERSGVSQARVGEALGVMPDTYRHYEAGRHLPSVTDLPVIAAALGVSACDLCCELFEDMPEAEHSKVTELRPRQHALSMGTGFVAAWDEYIRGLPKADREAVQSLLGVIDHIIQRAG